MTPAGPGVTLLTGRDHPRGAAVGPAVPEPRQAAANGPYLRRRAPGCPGPGE